MKRKITKIFLILLSALMCLGMLTGCADKETVATIEKDTRKMIDSLISADQIAAYSVIKNGCSESEFKEFFDYIIQFFKDIDEYELKQTGWNVKANRSGTFYVMEYKLSYSNGEKSLQITATAKKDVEGLVGFRVQ